MCALLLIIVVSNCELVYLYAMKYYIALSCRIDTHHIMCYYVILYHIDNLLHTYYTYTMHYILN